MTLLAWIVFTAAAIAAAIAIIRTMRSRGLRRLPWLLAFLTADAVWQTVALHAHYSMALALLIAMAIYLVVYAVVAQIGYLRRRHSAPQPVPTENSTHTAA